MRILRAVRVTGDLQCSGFASAAHQDAIYLNSKLFARVKRLYERRASLVAIPEAQQLVTVYYQQFVHAGAQLPEADKAKLRTLNQQLSTLETAFERELLAATQAGALVSALLESHGAR